MQDVDLVLGAQPWASLSVRPNFLAIDENLDERTDHLRLVPEAVPKSWIPRLEVVKECGDGPGARLDRPLCYELGQH